MSKKNTTTTKMLALAAAVFTASTLGSVGQSASATISDTAVSGGFDYTILLHNTGTTNLNSFWYGWTQSGNNLPSDPTTAGNSLGWGNNPSGNSIKWVNATGTALAPGNTASFTFFSIDTLSAISSPPSGDSVAYVNGITFSQGVTGDSTGIFSPVPTPEPSLASLFGAGALGLLLVGKKLHRRQPAVPALPEQPL